MCCNSVVYRSNLSGSSVIRDLGECLFFENLSQLYAPKGISFELVDKLKIEATELNISYTSHSRDHNLSLEDWCSALILPKIPKEFLEEITRFSSQPLQDSLFYPLKLSSFCELRAALAALNLDPVKDVTACKPNSTLDKVGADITLHLNNGKDQALQIKARHGKLNKRKPGIPTLTNVAVSSLLEIKSNINRLLN